jgi:hypothetical protein
VHVADKDKIWALRKEFQAYGYGMVWADIGIKTGTGHLVDGVLLDVEGKQMVVGGKAPFTGVNQDIFFFEEDGKEHGVDVLRYVAERARATWPKEVIPVSGWYNPRQCQFGGYQVQALPKDSTDWYMKNSYGPQWKTHDGQGDLIETPSCAWHSSHRREL